VMWRQVGILRNGRDLSNAIERLEHLSLPKEAKPCRQNHELRNLHALGLLITRSALAREESRGSHYRSDFPYRDDENFRKHSLVSRGEQVKFEA